jgi:hypothetical protein
VVLGGGGEGAFEAGGGVFEEFGDGALRGFGEGADLGAEAALDVNGFFEHFGEIVVAGFLPFFVVAIGFFDAEFEIDEADFDGGEGDDDVVEEEVTVGEAVFVEFLSFGVEVFEEFPEGNELDDVGLLGDGDIAIEGFGAEGGEPGEGAAGDETGAEGGAGGADGGGNADNFGGESVFFEFFIGVLVEAGGVIAFAEVDGEFFGAGVFFAGIGAGEDEVALDEGLTVGHFPHERVDDLVVVGRVLEEGEVLRGQFDLVVWGDGDHDGNLGRRRLAELM